MSKKQQSGFTLVELAIVMIIIGLLIGGVLKGQQLIQNARTTAVISEIKGYQAALNSFRDTYGGAPGDMGNARDRIAGCNDASFCENGNGNSLVGGSGAAADTGIINFWQLGDVTIGGEPVQFFKHLALSDLITGINPSTNTIAWGESFPSSSLRGGYTITYTTCVGINCQASPGGLVLRLQSSLTAANIEMPAGAAPTSSLEASRIDQKLDDGIPDNGWIRAMANGNGAAVAHCEVTYNGTKDRDCTMAFRIDG